MVPRMVYSELCRITSRSRLWLFVGLVCGYGVAASWLEVPALVLGTGVAPSARLYFAVSLQTLWLLVVGISLVAGGSLADDRRSGYLVSQRSRGVTPSQLVASRLCAVVVVALLSVAIAAGVLGLYAVSVGADNTKDLHNAVSFAPQLLEDSPLGYLALASVLNGIAAGALLGCSVFIGALTTAKFLSEIGPPLGVLVLGFAMVGPMGVLNPLERASFMQFSGAAWASPRSMLVYWSGVLAFAAVGAALAARRRDGL